MEQQKSTFEFLKEYLNKLGFPRNDEKFDSNLKTAIQNAQTHKSEQTFVLNRERSAISIVLKPSTKDDRVFVNSFLVTGKSQLRFPMGDSQPTMKAMENAANERPILLVGYKPKDADKPANDVWFQQVGDKRNFVSGNDFKIPEQHYGHKFTEQEIKDLQRGNTIKLTDCKEYKKGSNVPVGDLGKDVLVWPVIEKNDDNRLIGRVGFKQIDRQQSQSNEVSQESSLQKKTNVDIAKTVSEARAESQNAEPEVKKRRAAKV